MKKPRVTIIIPIYNEEKVIKKSLRQLIGYIDKNKLNFEVIVFDDCSTDKTLNVIPKNIPNYVRIIKNKKREGKGKCISKAIAASKGSIIIFLDADLSFDLNILSKLIKAVVGGADIAIGSRLLPNSTTKRMLYRSFASRCYNWLVRLMFDSKVHDHQCGCKSFKKKKIAPLLPQVKSDHWFWDTELLILAQKKGLKVVEIPINWWEGAYTHINFIKDTSTMFSDLITFRFRLGRLNGRRHSYA